MRIDLHTHSSASDGTDTPGDLVREAAAAGLDVVALTDHDAMSGWAEAAQVADEVGITLVPGLEISTRYGHRGVHLLGYLPDPTHPGLVLELDRNGQAVTHARHRLDDPLLFVVAQRDPQFANGRRQRRLDHRDVRPDAF